MRKLSLICAIRGYKVGGFYARGASGERSYGGRAGAFDSNILIGRLRMVSGDVSICCRESSVVYFRSRRALHEALQHIDRSGQIVGVICAEEMASQELLGKLSEQKMPYFLLGTAEELASDADGRIALIDFGQGRLIIDPTLDTLNRYSRTGADDHPSERSFKESVIGDRSVIKDCLHCNSRDGAGLLCGADDISSVGDFFEAILSLAESPSGGALCIRLSVPSRDDEDAFCERIDVLFRSAVYGELSVMLEGYRSIADIERAIRLMYKSYCRLEDEGREINAALARGLMIDSPIWLIERRNLPRVDFLCFDFDRLCGSLLGISPVEAVCDPSAVETLCKFWEDYRRANQLHERAELRAKSDRLFESELFSDWVEFMGISEIYLPKGRSLQKNT